jgi:DnaJ domain
MKDFYYILGTPRDAAAPEIEAAYQKLARKFADEQDAFMDAHFREIAEAYDILRDAPRRRKYDAALRRSQKKQMASFKLKYLNIAATLTLLAVTALFAGYVIRTINGHPAKKIVPKPTAQPAAVAAVTHVKKHHKTPAATQPTVSHPAPGAVPTPHPAPPAMRLAPTDSATLHANITGIVYLHQSPDYNSVILTKIPDAARVRILQKGDAWCCVSYNGQQGYVIKGAVKQ